MTIQSNFPAIRPTLNLNFSNAEVLDPRITFARATTATYYGTETALAEQNLLLRSQELDNAAWAKNDVAVTANTIAAPDGTTTADTVQTTISTASHSVQTVAGVSIVSGFTYTFSVFAKYNTNDFVQIAQFGSGNPLGTTRANFDISTGVVGTVSGGTSTITDVGNGWYRCTLTVTATANGVITVFLNLITSSTAARFESWTAAGTESVYLWGAQAEQRSAVSAYTPTTTNTITNFVPVLEIAASGEARFDHNPVTFESLGLLIEEQRTNLLLQSENLDTTWSETRATLSLNSVVAPNGTLTEDVLIASTDNDTHFTTQTFTGTAVSHTFSAYAKANGLNHVALRLFNGSTQVGLAYYNLTTGATGTVTAGTASIQSVGNGLYRCSLTATLAASASCTADIFLANADNTNSFAGNAFDGVSLWGFQVEAGAFATSYIPTVASQVTRLADLASMTEANFSSWYRQDEGSFVTEVIANHGAIAGSQIRRFLNIRNDTSSENIRFGRGAPNLAIRFAFVKGGVVQAGAPASAFSFGTIVPNNSDIFAVGYSATIPSLVLDGTKATDLTSEFNGLPVGMTQMSIGSAGVANLTDILNGTIKRVAFYPARLSNTQLQALTS